MAKVAAGVTVSAAYVFFTGFAAALVRFGLFIAFLVFLFFIACPLRGTREQYTCLEGSKIRSNRVAGAPLTMPQPGDFFACNQYL